MTSCRGAGAFGLHLEIDAGEGGIVVAGAFLAEFGSVLQQGVEAGAQGAVAGVEADDGGGFLPVGRAIAEEDADTVGGDGFPYLSEVGPEAAELRGVGDDEMRAASFDVQVRNYGADDFRKRCARDDGLLVEDRLSAAGDGGDFRAGYLETYFGAGSNGPLRRKSSVKVAEDCRCAARCCCGVNTLAENDPLAWRRRYSTVFPSSITAACWWSRLVGEGGVSSSQGPACQRATCRAVDLPAGFLVLLFFGSGLGHERRLPTVAGNSRSMAMRSATS